MKKTKITMENEIWKIIPDYPQYKASNLGRIMGPRTILKPNLRKTGYLYSNLTINGVNKAVATHRLVMQAFFGKSKLDVHHINEIRTDNRLENLKYVTVRENQQAKKTFRGCYYCKYTNKWKTEYTSDGKRIWLGRFDTIEEASAAYFTAVENATNKNSKGQIIE